MAAAVDIVVAIIVGPIISVGFLAPAADNMAMVEAGIRVTEDVFMAKKVTIASVAVSFFLLSFCSSSMAFRPKGVAALPKPKILAEIFIIMAPMAGWSGGTSGNKRTITGFKALDMIFIRPESSAIFIMPSHMAITPIRPKASSTAVLAFSMAAVVTWSIFPFMAPTKKPIRINPAQMMLIIITPRLIN